MTQSPPDADPPPDITPSKPASLWEPLRAEPVFRALWIANFVSTMGSWMHDVSAQWLMKTLTGGDPLFISLIAPAMMGPVVLLSLPGGALADIFDRRRFLMLSQAWMMMAAGGLAWLSWSGEATPARLLGVTVLMGTGAAFAFPAWAAIIPELVGKARLPQAIMLNGIAINGARIIGPSVAGLIIASFGPSLVFAVNAVTFLGIIVVLARWRRDERPSHLPAERFVAAMRTGARYVAQSPVLKGVLLRAFTFFFLSSALLALLAKLTSDPRTFGMLTAAIGVGAIMGALALPRLTHRWSRDVLVPAAIIVHAGTVATLSQTSDPLFQIPALIVAGACWIIAMASIQVAAQTALPEWVRARGISFLAMAFTGGIALGGPMWGLLARNIGIEDTFLIAAVAAFAGALLTARVRIGGHDDLDLSPADAWAMPEINLHPEDDRAALVTLRYVILDADRDEFLARMGVLRRQRLRNGAYRWGLHQNAVKPGEYMEYFVDPSWLDHLRQQERQTRADHADWLRVLELHQGEGTPEISHYVVEQVPLR